MRSPRYLAAGDAALIVEFGDQIDREISQRVVALAKELTRHPIPGLVEVVPTYRSALIHYDPLRSSYDEMVEGLRSCGERMGGLRPEGSRLLEIPTTYGGEYGPDLQYVAEHNGLSVQQVVQIHSSADYYVYMLGFLPGFPYLGGLDPRIATPRLSTPRSRVAVGSVGIGGGQTGVYPVESPGGWRIIGRTAIKLFDASQDPPALLKPGDRVRFVPLSGEEIAGGGRDH